MKKEKHDMHLPRYVHEGIGIDNHPRKFHFWHDIIPFFVCWVENEFNLPLHHGHKSGKICTSMREGTASKLGPRNSSNRKNNHG